MHPEWFSFLKAQSAAIEGSAVIDFGDRAAELQACEQGTVLCDLSHRGLLRVTGEDAVEFLQGQLTNDVHQLREGRSHLSAYCDHKGRILALFRLWRSGDTFHLTLPVELLEMTLKRLKMFLLRSKATIEDHSGEMIRIGLAGPGAKTLLERSYEPLPAGENHVVEHDGGRITRLPGADFRYEIHLPLEAARPLWTALAKEARPAGRDAWRLLDIRSVCPDVFSETREAFTPQMLNLEVLDGVSFTKGCYTGQEVVARTQFLGKIKRRTYAAHIPCDTVPGPGVEVVGEQAAGAQAAGRIVVASPSPKGGCEALVMVQISARSDDTLHLETADGPVLEFIDPPYSLEQVRPGSQ